MIKFFILFIFLTSSIFGLRGTINEDTVAKQMIAKANKYGIDVRMLYTIASIESNFEPLAIAVETSYARAQILKELKSKDIKILTGMTYHSKIHLVSIYPKNYKTAVFIIHQLEKMGFGFDVGLMQINTVNFSLSEVKKMFDPERNLEKACKHLSGCLKRFKNKIHQVECYNRGGGNLSKMLRKKKYYYPYWKRYQRHWKKYF